MVMDWMYDNFDLNVAEANALGLIYGFCQDGESWYQGGSSYIAARLHISQKSAKNYLADFTRRGILRMKKVMVGNVERNAYQTVPDIETLILRKDADPVKNFTGEKFSPVKKIPSDPGKFFPQTRENFSRKNKIEKKKEKSIYLRDAQKTDGLMDESADLDALRERFRQQLELGILAKRYDPQELAELLDAVVEMYACPDESQQVGQQLQSTKVIRQQLDKLTSRHIEYIMESMSNTTQPIKNIHSYLRVTILRAPTTIEHYYKAQSQAAVAQTQQTALRDMAGASIRRLRTKRGDGA